MRAFAERRVSFVDERFADVAAANPDLASVEVLARIFTEEGYAAAVRESPVG